MPYKNPIELVNNMQELPKGTSTTYTDEINKKYNDAVSFLKEKGYDVNSFNQDSVKQHIDKLFVDHDNELKAVNKNLNNLRMPANTGNELWNLKYKPIYNALDVVSDKLYNDDFIKKAPFGFAKK